MNVAPPIIREDLGFLEVSVSELQWVVNAYALSFAVPLLSAGKLADLFGRKRLFIIGLDHLHRRFRRPREPRTRSTC